MKLYRTDSVGDWMVKVWDVNGQEETTYMPDETLGRACTMMVHRANEVWQMFGEGKVTAQVIERDTEKILDMCEVGF